MPSRSISVYTTALDARVGKLFGEICGVELALAGPASTATSAASRIYPDNDLAGEARQAS